MRWNGTATGQGRAERERPLADLLTEISPSAAAFPLALIEALIDRVAMAPKQRWRDLP